MINGRKEDDGGLARSVSVLGVSSPELFRVPYRRHYSSREAETVMELSRVKLILQSSNINLPDVSFRSCGVYKN
jgi:hypothetical protein